MALLGGYRGGGGQQLYLATNSTQASGELVAGRYGLASGSRGRRLATGPGDVATADHEIIELSAHRGLRIKFFGTDGDDETFAYRLWGVKYLTGNGQPEHAEIRLMGTGTGALGDGVPKPVAANLGADSQVVPAGAIMADTLTWAQATAGTSPKGPDAVIAAANGGTLATTAYSPGNDAEEAMLVVPDVFDYDGVVVEVFTGGSAASVNCLFELTR